LSLRWIGRSLLLTRNSEVPEVWDLARRVPYVLPDGGETSDNGTVRIWDALWNQTAYAAAIGGRTTFGVTETLELVEGRFGGLPWLRAAIPMPVEGCGELKRP
jgi:hypothetical protein